MSQKSEGMSRCGFSSDGRSRLMDDALPVPADRAPAVRAGFPRRGGKACFSSFAKKTAEITVRV